MASKLVTMDSLPSEFMDTVMKEFRPYTAGLGRIRDAKDSQDGKKDPATYQPLGSGVFVTRGSRFGILTAHHCLHQCSGPEVSLGPSGKDTLLLALNRHSVAVPPTDCFEHVLARPRSAEFGPDLTFIEIFGDKRASIRGTVSAWPLEKERAEAARDLARPTMVAALVGFPEEYATTKVQTEAVHRDAKHMTFVSAIAEGALFEREGWDYLDSQCNYGGRDPLPNSFGGVSGGPVWGMRLRLAKDTGAISIDASALIGIVFYQGPPAVLRNVRAHLVGSIYEKAWESSGL